jgi:HEAT repeat protein
VAKAAQWCAEGLHYELLPDLVQAYNRFLQDPVKTDKTCAAKRALCRALYELDYDNAAFYQRGLRYTQLEPVWGGSVDTAVDIRCTCALGLVSTGFPRAMLDLLELLHDDEPQARVGAVKAMAMAQSYQAEIALRHKILQGDSEPEVMAQCFSSLMEAAPEQSWEFVAGYLHHPQDAVVESAALALGESRLDEALDLLIEHSGQTALQASLQLPLFRAIALQRKEKAFDYLLTVIEQEAPHLAEKAIVALAIYSYNDTLQNKIENILRKRRSQKLTAAFQEYWL